MRESYVNKLLIVCLLSFLVAGAGCCINFGGCDKYKCERTDQLQQKLDAGSTLAVRTDFGSISVNGGDVNECVVTAHISVRAPSQEEAEQIAQQVSIELEQVDERLTVKVNKPHLGNNRSVAVSFEITVPRQTDIDCYTSYGALRLAEIEGDVKGQTSFASVTCEDIKGTIDLGTSYGSVTCRDIVSSDLKLRSSFGGINVGFSPLAPGDITADVSTSYGSIDFAVPSGFGGEVELSTSFGSIKTQLPITIAGEISRERIRGKIGDGKGSIQLKTSFGSIKIR